MFKVSARPWRKKAPLACCIFIQDCANKKIQKWLFGRTRADALVGFFSTQCVYGLAVV